MFSEQVSSVAERAQLEAALEFVREGDEFVVTKVDRLARSSAHLNDIVQRLEKKGVSLRVLSFGKGAINTKSPQDKFFVQMMVAMAEFERGIMLERQREGIAKAKREGKYRGRKPTVQAKAAQIFLLHREGVSPSEIAKRLGVGRASVYRVLASSAA